ncbi:hypothetical protein SUNI508_11429 [Seiridium unicorne]|uniref:Uncharacterized protein n=1 Tax=Seiridium unicorne TaxID=138068 RepID=A0ABR2UH69_9PEZI
MKFTYLHAAVLYGLSVTAAQTTTDPAQTTSTDAPATDDQDSTSTSLSLITTPLDQPTTTSLSITDASTTITSADSSSGTLLTTGDLSSDILSSSSLEAISTINTTAITTASNSSTTQRRSSTATPVTLPKSTDAAQYLSFAFPPGAPQPTWATGALRTKLATALYGIDRSFVQRTDYETIVSAINSAADNAGSQVSASVDASAWGWGVVTTNTWYQSRVPAPLQTEVLDYNNAWHSAASSVQALASAAQPSSTAGAPPRCTGMVLAGIAAGVAGAVIAA